MNHGFKLHPDGTLEITMPRGKKVGRVLVCEAGTQNGRIYNPESDAPGTNVGDMINCTDCIKHGGDWECDHVHCHKGTKQQATKASNLIDRQAAVEVADAVWTVTGDKNVAKVWQQIKDLPSAEPEIIRCKDCKHWREGTVFEYCYKLYEMGAMDAYDYMTTEDDFCSYAERREGGEE